MNIRDYTLKFLSKQASIAQLLRQFFFFNTNDKAHFCWSRQDAHWMLCRTDWTGVYQLRSKGPQALEWFCALLIERTCEFQAGRILWIAREWQSLHNNSNDLLLFFMEYSMKINLIFMFGLWICSKAQEEIGMLLPWQRLTLSEYCRWKYKRKKIRQKEKKKRERNCLVAAYISAMSCVHLPWGHPVTFFSWA